jgi:hypothetical protein
MKRRFISLVRVHAGVSLLFRFEAHLHKLCTSSRVVSQPPCLKYGLKDG